MIVKTICRIIKHGSALYYKNSKPQKMGNKIVILGNGNSAVDYKNNQKLFSDYDLLVSNYYPIKENDFWKFKPKYLCLFDPKFFAPDGVFYTDLHRSQANDLKGLKDALEKVDWDLKIITRVGNVLKINNDKIEYIYLSKSISNFNVGKLNRFLFKNNIAIPNSQNVVIGALYFAEVFGYTEIALFGVEQNWLQNLYVDKHNLLWVENQHFYGTTKVKVNATYRDEMKDMVEIFDGFNFSAKIAKFYNIRIVNYATESYLQSFDKIKL